MSNAVPRSPAGTALPDGLDFYAHPAGVSAGGRHAPALADLPREVGALAGIVQGLLIHQFKAGDYGCPVPEPRKRESHIRPLEAMLDALLAHDARPLAMTRLPKHRLVGVCRHFALLTTAMLRAHSIPARMRGGFATYFNPGYFEDHWVCEYWNAAEARWVLVDAQIDDVHRATLDIGFDPLDVPRDRFIVAGDAWLRCRLGKADPSKFGIFFGNLRGLWFIAGDQLRDLAALNKQEMLAWDAWGAMPRPDQVIDADDLALFDRVAKLTRAPDAGIAELRALYQGNPRLSVPPIVLNTVLDRTETL